SRRSNPGENVSGGVPDVIPPRFEVDHIRSARSSPREILHFVLATKAVGRRSDLTACLAGTSHRSGKRSPEECRRHHRQHSRSRCDLSHHYPLSEKDKETRPDRKTKPRPQKLQSYDPRPEKNE